MRDWSPQIRVQYSRSEQGRRTEGRGERQRGGEGREERWRKRREESGREGGEGR